jgi:hypothetical protein
MDQPLPSPLEEIAQSGLVIKGASTIYFGEWSQFRTGPYERGYAVHCTARGEITLQSTREGEPVTIKKLYEDRMELVLGNIALVIHHYRADLPHKVAAEVLSQRKEAIRRR